jgi:DNA-binding response OmpR family regulator
MRGLALGFPLCFSYPFDTYVRRLRRTFEAVDPAFDGIETVIGAGYRWRA